MPYHLSKNEKKKKVDNLNLWATFLYFKQNMKIKNEITMQNLWTEWEFAGSGTNASVHCQWTA